MTLSLKNTLIGTLAVVLGMLAVYAFTQNTFGAMTIESPASVNVYRTYDFFASTTAATGSVSTTVLATTTTATSTNITAFNRADTGERVDGAFNITGAKQVTLYFGRGGATNPNTGSTQYKIQTTRDGSNWDDYTGQYVSATSTTFTMQGYPSITAATSTVLFGMNLDYTGYKAIRCIVVETTDGEHACAAAATF